MALTKATLIDLNSNELILDLDADTSITADTDDTIHFKIAGSDEITMTATAFAPSTSDGQALGTSSLMFADLFLASGSVVNFNNGDVTLTHSSNTLTLGGGALDVDGGITIDNITIDGTEIDLSSGDLTIDVAGDIVLDAGGADVIIKDDGTTIATFTNSSTDFIIESATSDKDIIFKVNDGGSSTEVARFDGDVSALLMASGKELRFADSGEKISGDGTDLTIASGAKINLTATSDVHIPNNVGIVFGGDSEKIEGDGTDLVISANNLTVDAAADITLDAAGNDLNFAAGGTTVLTVSNSSSDVIIKPVVDTKDLIFQQRDGTEVARIEDNGTFNIVTDKLAINATAVTATAAELNLLDGGTSVGSSITLADADGFVVNDGGTMKTIPASDIKTYNPGGTAWQSVITSNTTMVAGRGYFVNTSGGAITMTLPSSASIGDTVQVIDYGATADTNNITIGRNSHKIQGDAADLTVSTERAAFTLVYVDATQGWLLDSK